MKLTTEERRFYERRNLRRTAAVSALRASGLTDRQIGDRLGRQGAESPALLAVGQGARSAPTRAQETSDLAPYEWPPDPLADERLTEEERTVARAMGLTVEQVLAARSHRDGGSGG